MVGEQVVIGLNRNKPETLSANGTNAQRASAQLANQPVNAQAMRKRRSSINVYDQPSSLNSRLRQLETDMLRLDEDRTKLFDDTHLALQQYELKLGEIHAILKSRQDNVEKYVEDMKMLLQAKEEFERQSKLLHEKHVSCSSTYGLNCIGSPSQGPFLLTTRRNSQPIPPGANPRKVYASRDDHLARDQVAQEQV